MTWTELDWTILDRLRERFLASGSDHEPYWQSLDDLAHYDFTYAERIGWKWDHVIRELRLRQWQPSSRTILDWGCGSGIASRRVLTAFGPEHFDAVTLWDHSPLAVEFATDQIERAFPGLAVHQATSGWLAGSAPIGLLVVSHVLNELPPESLVQLRGLVDRAEAVLWVEPGTHAVSRQMGQLRDAWREQFTIIAPCTHALGCPVFAPDRERDWCHFFAPPPSEIFADSNWVKFGQRAGIDLRSLPYCFVALQRPQPRPRAQITDTAWSRIIGRPEFFKPYARFLNCDASGLTELELPKRTGNLFKQLERTKAPLVYRWQRDDRRVTAGEPLSAPA